MRLDIQSEDRIGITNDILNTFADKGWDLGAMEMHLHHTYVLINESVGNKKEAFDFQNTQNTVNLIDVERALLTIPGVQKVLPMKYLPSEQKRRHLNALLEKLPDPILDVNNKGEVLVANHAAEVAFSVNPGELEGQSIATLTNTALSDILNDDPISIDIAINNQSFLMDITPIHMDKQTSGAVIMLRSPQRLGQELSAIQPQTGNSIESIIGNSVTMKAIKQQTKRFSTLDMPVLIQGETGTGKELFARALHESGPRSTAPFLAINCATLAENLLESELFGYASGAFTGASRGGKPGLFELAENGTVFLDEIGEMSIYLQAKLLRFLQEFTFRRIGGTREIKVNVRIVCATHQSLDALVQAKQFREDLYYRLNVLNLNLPPLRERQEDIPELVSAFAINAAEQINQPCPSFSVQVINSLINYPWPGNVRQLQNVVFRTLALSDKPLIEVSDLHISNDVSNSLVLHAPSSQQNVQQINQQQFNEQQLKDQQFNEKGSERITNLGSAVAAFEKKLLGELYNEFPSSRKLAKRLGVSHANIHRKLKKYQLV